MLTQSFNQESLIPGITHGANDARTQDLSNAQALNETIRNALNNNAAPELYSSPEKSL